MRTVKLVASGYTWSCAECGGENYTGAAPRQVVCDRCQAQFAVADLAHRMADLQEQQMNLFDLEGEESRRVALSDESPF